MEVPASFPTPSPITISGPVRVAPPIRVRHASPIDDALLVEAANTAFGLVDPNHRPVDVELWRWKYRDAPERGRNVIATDRDDQISGHYGAMGQRLLVERGALRVTHATDSLAAGPAGPGLAGVRGFLAAGEGFAEAAIFEDTFTWGLPVARALRLGERFLSYRFLCAQLALVAPLEALTSGGSSELAAHVVDEVPRGIESLAREASDGRARFERSRAWYEWRFVHHPRERYELFAVEDGRGCRGLAVYRTGSFDRHAGGLICDWLVAPGDDEAERALLAALARRARFDGVSALVAAWPQSAPEFGRFERSGFRAHSTRYPLVTRNWGAGPDEGYLRDHWTFTLGDTDLC